MCFPDHCVLFSVLSSPSLFLGSNSVSRAPANTENGENEGTAKIIAPSPVKRSVRELKERHTLCCHKDDFPYEQGSESFPFDNSLVLLIEIVWGPKNALKCR